MVKIAGEWYIDHDTERLIYGYLRDRLHTLHNERIASPTPDVQTPEEVRVIDLIVAIDLCHIGKPLPQGEKGA